MMRMSWSSARTVPVHDRRADDDGTVCPDCRDPAGLCDCDWRIMQLDASYSIYAALDGDAGKPTATPVSSSAAPPYYASLLELDGLNCGGIPTRTTPTLTPTTLRNIEADIANLTPSTSEDFAAAAASDLHHLVSASCSSINVSVAENIDRLNSEVLERHNLQNLGIQQISIQNLNNQNIIINNLPSHQQINQNTLNQQQRNDYNNSFSVAPSRQAGFVPPLVLQINATNGIAQQPTGTTVLLNTNNSSVFSTKGLSTSTSTSHWQGAVVTQRPQQRPLSAIKRQYTDDEDGEEDFNSDFTDDSSDTFSSKTTRKSNTKNNKSSLKTTIKSEFKNTTNTPSGGGRGRANKNNKIMSAEEEQRRQIRRERNKMAAARCRKRRMDHTNELLEETEQLEEKRLRLQVQMDNLHQQKSNLQQMLAQHKCVVNMNSRSVSNAVSTVNHVPAVLDTNSMSESNTSVLSNESSSSNRNLQQNITIKTDNDSVDDILIKCEDPVMDEENKDDINIIPTSVMPQTSRRRPTTLLQLNSGNYGNCKKIPGNDPSNVVVLNFDSLMDGGTGLTPISTSVGSVQGQQRNSTNSGNNNILS